MPNANPHPQEIRLYFQGILEPPWCPCVHCVYFSQLTLNSCNSLLDFFPSKSQYYTHPPKIPFPPTDVFGFAWVILLIANPWSWKYLLRRSLGSKYLLKFGVWKGIFALQKKTRDPITFWEWEWNLNTMLKRWLNNTPIILLQYDGWCL